MFKPIMFYKKVNNCVVILALIVRERERRRVEGSESPPYIAERQRGGPGVGQVNVRIGSWRSPLELSISQCWASIFLKVGARVSSSCSSRESALMISASSEWTHSFSVRSIPLPPPVESFLIHLGNRVNREVNMKVNIYIQHSQG